MLIERQFSQGPAPKEVEDLWLFPALLARGYSYIAVKIFILRLSEFFLSPSQSVGDWPNYTTEDMQECEWCMFLWFYNTRIDHISAELQPFLLDC